MEYDIRRTSYVLKFNQIRRNVADSNERIKKEGVAFLLKMESETKEEKPFIFPNDLDKIVPNEKEPIKENVKPSEQITTINVN